MRSKEPILLVEDDRVDAMIVHRALKDIHITNRLEVVRDGEEALAFLRDENAGKPCIILLDLNMPSMDGIELLRLAKQDGLLRRIPVVVLTTSQEEHHKVESFELGAAGYMVKPVDYLQFVEVVRAINLYWTLSEFPA